jgi:bacterioferritin
MSSKAANQKLIDALNEIKQAEITAVLQYLAHGEYLKNMGLEPLAKMFFDEAEEEMGHITNVGERIYQIGGKPKTMPLSEPKMAKDFAGILDLNIDMEAKAVDRYNEAIAHTLELRDGGTRVILEKNLVDEEEHLNELRQMRENLGRFGTGFLACICGQGIPMASPPSA